MNAKTWFYNQPGFREPSVGTLPKSPDLVRAEPGKTCDGCHGPALVVDLNAADDRGFYCDARGFCAVNP